MQYVVRLEEQFEALQRQAIMYDDASKFMVQEISKSKIQRLLKNQTKSRLSDIDKLELKLLLNMALAIYTYSGLDTGMTDSEYDQLVSMHQRISGNHSFTINDIKSNKEYHKYPILRGTLHKVYSLGEQDIHQKTNDHRETLDQWIKQTEELLYVKTGTRYHLNEETVLCFPKWDGVSCIFEFENNKIFSRALTRGHTDINTAKNITCHFQDVSGAIPSPHGLKTEIMVLDETVDEYSIHMKKRYSQSRSVASAIINSNSPTDFDSSLVIKKLRYYSPVEGGPEDLCSEVFDDPYLRCKLGNRNAIIHFAEDHHQVNGLRCDGVVIRLTNPNLIRLLGRNNDRNNYEVAYKFTEESAYSTVEGIKFQMGLFGRLTPVVQFTPVKLKGNTVQNASLGSMGRFRSLNLSVGDTIKVLYDIIPYVTIDSFCKISNRNPILEPRYCPDCGHLLIKEGEILKCVNKDCEWVNKGQIINFVSKMKIRNISGATIIKLYDAGYLRTIDDLYRLKNCKKELRAITGLGKESVNRILDSIAETENGITASMLLGSIGIEGSSWKTFLKIFQLFSLSEVLEFAKDKRYDYLMEIEGIGEKKAKAILRGIRKELPVIENLATYIGILPENTPLFTVCFSKIRDVEKEEFIHSMGGLVVDNINAKTSLLVVPNLNVSSTKIEKAKKYEIPIVHIDDLESHLNELYMKIPESTGK